MTETGVKVFHPPKIEEFEDELTHRRKPFTVLAEKHVTQYFMGGGDPSRYRKVLIQLSEGEGVGMFTTTEGNRLYGIEPLKVFRNKKIGIEELGRLPSVIHPELK